MVVPKVQSQVNLSRIVRAAGCFGIRELISLSSVKVDRTIARDAADYVAVYVHRSLPPVVQKYREQGYRVVGLEQTTNSVCLYD